MHLVLAHGVRVGGVDAETSFAPEGDRCAGALSVQSLAPLAARRGLAARPAGFIACSGRRCAGPDRRGVCRDKFVLRVTGAYLMTRQSAQGALALPSAGRVAHRSGSGRWRVLGRTLGDTSPRRRSGCQATASRACCGRRRDRHVGHGVHVGEHRSLLAVNEVGHRLGRR